MAAGTANTELIAQAQAYVTELYQELTTENGAPTLGTQNQGVDFILADPELCRAVASWARTARIAEATTKPSRRLPDDAAYRCIRDYLQATMERPVFARPKPNSG
jgi:hypothetical protein